MRGEGGGGVTSTSPTWSLLSFPRTNSTISRSWESSFELQAAMAGPPPACRAAVTSLVQKTQDTPWIDGGDRLGWGWIKIRIGGY